MTLKSASIEIVSTIGESWTRFQNERGAAPMTWLPLEIEDVHPPLRTTRTSKSCTCDSRAADVYRYFGRFPDDNYLTFLGAESKGRFFLAHIRDSFRYERMARLSAA